MLSENYIDKLAAAGVVPPLIQLLTSDQADVQEHGRWRIAARRTAVLSLPLAPSLP
jgi:hypothetical protein